MLERVPDQSLLVDSATVPAERVQATRGRDYLFVYSAVGKPFTVRLGKISGTALRATWFDPRTGNVEPIGTIDNAGTRLFSPPRAGYGQDWVLILDDDAKAYPAP